MTVRIPNNDGKFSQPNKGDIFGNIYRTQNIDLKTAPGKLRVSSRLIVNTKSDDVGISNMGVPLAFVAHTQASTKQYYAACGIGTGATTGSGKILVSASTTPNSAFANDVVANSPTTIHADYSDMVEWVRCLYVSKWSGAANNISKLDSSWTASWYTGTAGGSFTTAGGPKTMCVGFNGNLYVTDDDLVTYVNTAGTAVLSGTGTIDFLGAYRPIWIRSSSNKLWISLMEFDASFGTKGYIGMWDGTGTALNTLYYIDAPCALSGVVLNDVLYILDAYGILKKFDGGGFKEVARLPVANQNIEMPGIYNDLTVSRWVHMRGMDIVDGKINIVVNNFVSTGVYVKDMPSGVWEYDPEIGLYHKDSPCATTSDYGQQGILTSGAIMGTKRSTATMLVGGAHYTDDVTTSKNAIYYDDIATNTNKRGIVTTPFVNSAQIKDTFKEVGYRFRPIPSGDKIIGKYRYAKKANLPFIASITWTSTTTFTSTDANFAYASDGDEIEVFMGKGASTTAHISGTPVLNTGTYTVTLDDTIGFSSGTGKVTVDNFKKTGAISEQDISSQELTVGNDATRIQVKTEIRATGDFELDDITIASETIQEIA